MKLADRGVIPRILSHVFRRGKKIAKDSDGQTAVDVALSYYEIYNDKVYDLLEPPEKRTPAGLPLREKDNRTHVVGLSEQRCADVRDFERLYVAANQNRVTAATKLNAHSSRSHAILRVKVTQTTRAADGSGAVVAVRESTASAIDLAGSEDNRRTDNGRERLVESAAINKSLFVLSQCVDAIARGEKRIPYRESKMTRILSLGQNNGITVMILNLAPLRSYHLDTLSSLNVSSRAKRIEVREIENEVVFKQLPRSLASSAASSAASSTTSLSAATLSSVPSAASRQPLRALTSNTHNIQAGVAAATARAAGDKPVKAFSVYTDRVVAPSTSSVTLPLSRMGPLANISHARASLAAASKVGGGKRPSDQAEARPSKLARPSIHHPYSALSIARTAAAASAAAAAAAAPPPPPPPPAAVTPHWSAEQIEAIIERKVAEALAARAQEEEAKQRRLDALERRIDDSMRDHHDDPRAEGLRFLLLARQHKEVGDDAAALRYYAQAQPFFPGQAKLLGKMEKLKAKLAGDAKAAAATAAASCSPRKQPRSSHKRKRLVAVTAAIPMPATPTRRKVLSDDDAEGDRYESDADVEEEEEEEEAGDRNDRDGRGDADTIASEASPSRRGRGDALHTTPSRRHRAGSRARRAKAARTSGEADGADADDEAAVVAAARSPSPRTKRLAGLGGMQDVFLAGRSRDGGAAAAEADACGAERAAAGLETGSVPSSPATGRMILEQLQSVSGLLGQAHEGMAVAAV